MATHKIRHIPVAAIAAIAAALAIGSAPIVALIALQGAADARGAGQ